MQPNCVHLLLVCLVATQATWQQPFPEDRIIYPEGIHVEREMPACTSKASVCNILHRRFWYPMLVMRQCRCPKSAECPTDWATTPQNNTVHLDNRSQMKFCDEVTHLETCTSGVPALTFSSRMDKHKGHLIPKSQRVVETKMLCGNCTTEHYWRLASVNHTGVDEYTDTYHCEVLGRCRGGEFCGYIRADLYSTYYQCTCPPNHMCLVKNYKKTPVKELHFEGLAYVGICVNRDDM